MLGVSCLDELSTSQLKFVLSYATKKIQLGHNKYQIKVVGTSMLPTIKDGTTVNIIPIGSHSCKVGDVVCYNNSQYFVLHRIIGIIEKDGKTFYELKGDNLPRSDYNLVTKDQIVGYYIERENPFLNISYSSGDSINIITDLQEIRKFVLNICSKTIIKEKLCENNVRLNVIVYKEKDLYIIEAYKGLDREKICIESLLELKGELYSIIFHADAIKNLYSEYISLHAGSAIIKDKVVCIIGKTGQGKSTILYWLSKQNFKYLGDENFYIKIDSADGMPKIMPFYTPIMLRNDILAFTESNDIIEETLVKKEDGIEHKYAVCVEKILSKETNADVVFVVPKWKKNTITRLAKLNVQMAFEVLMENIQSGVPITCNTIKTLLKLASKFVFYEIEYSDNDDFILNIIQAIENKA